MWKRLYGADHAERLLRGALQTGAKGVNVLVYGPPGTGKTEFCKTLATRLEAHLHVVGESDSRDGEPSRNERLRELRLAQRLFAGDHRSILLFDEMEDLLSSQGSLVAALFGSREFDVTPGVASGVTTAARLGDGSIADVRRGVRSLARVMSGDTAPVQRTPQNFDPGLIRADVNPVQLADRLAGNRARHFSLCLQGPPGTGKSAFVRHLADRLGLEVLQKRASDLMSMWVGGTEKQVAEAFAEARDAEAFGLRRSRLPARRPAPPAA